MENLFERITENCENRNVKSLCNKLIKKLSFKSGKDVENLCHLVYWLYILGKTEFSIECIKLTHNVPFDQNYNVWDFIHFIWGLEIRIFRENENKIFINDVIGKIENNLKTPIKIETLEKAQLRENRRRERFTLESISNEKQIEIALNEGNNKSANELRFIALFKLIGYTETELYTNLTKEREKIETIIKEYIEEIKKKKNGVRRNCI